MEWKCFLGVYMTTLVRSRFIACHNKVSLGGRLRDIPKNSWERDYQ